MNGIYLNDIPIDVFMKYFSRDNLGSDSSFLTYNTLRQSGLSLLERRNNLLYSKVQPGVVALVNDGSSEKLELYQTFTKTTAYSILNNPSPIPVDFKIGLINPSLNGTSTSTNIKLNKIVLDIGKLKKFRLKRIGSNFSKLYNTDLMPEVGDIIIADTYQDSVVLKNRKLLIDSDSKIEYYTSEKISVITSLIGRRFIRIPVVNNSVSIFNDYTNNFENISIIKAKTSSRFILNKTIDGVNYEIQNPIVNYLQGYIDIPVDVEPVYKDTVIGVFGYLGTDITVSPYSTAPLGVDLSEHYESIGYQESGGNYTRTSYIKDAYQTDTYLEIIETVSIQSGNTIVYPTVNTILFDNFKKLFVAANAVVPELDQSDRGSLVPSGTIKKAKLSIIKKMVPEFLNNAYTDFYTVSNITYDVDGTMKMRIYADGLFNMLISERLDYFNLEKRFEKLTYTQIDNALILSNDILSSINLESKYNIGKEYDPRLVYGEVEDEIQSLNPYQKISEFETFPSDIIREDYLLKKNLRDSIYEDNTTSIKATDETSIIRINIERNFLSKIYFKNGIVNSLTEYFHDFGLNQPNEKYREEYTLYYKEKMDSIIEPDNVYSFQKPITEKKVYNSNDCFTPREDEMIKLMIKSDSNNKWGVL
jgi:hypothetical protein